jgi:hypothetical protein
MRSTRAETVVASGGGILRSGSPRYAWYSWGEPAREASWMETTSAAIEPLGAADDDGGAGDRQARLASAR